MLRLLLIFANQTRTRPFPMSEEQTCINFDEYIRQGEPQKKERAEAWRVAIGLQARMNIEGEITIDEARELVKEYYIKKTAHDHDDAEKEEADRVSSNISKLLQTDAFTYSVAGLAVEYDLDQERQFEQTSSPSSEISADGEGIGFI